LQFYDKSERFIGVLVVTWWFVRFSFVAGKRKRHHRYPFSFSVFFAVLAMKTNECAIGGIQNKNCNGNVI
jgi:hypothetical protein